MSPSDLSVIFAGGGTGGHLFPALAIAQALHRTHPGARSIFVCSQRPLDARILAGERIAEREIDFRPIPAQPVGLSPRRLFAFVRGWGGAVRASRAIMAQEKAAGRGVVVAAMGGFVAAPAVRAAVLEGCPAVMVNLDAVPGKANRWIAKRVDRVLTALPVKGRETWRCVGPIVREGAVARDGAMACRARLGLDPARPTLLVTGGSQGAQTINRLVTDRAHEGGLSGWQVIHQAGAGGADAVRAVYERAGVACVVEEFIRDMGTAWGAADLCVSRAGAGSVAEAWANRVPTLFLPYPFHRDGHQAANAMVLVSMGGAVLATDRIDPGANARVVAPILQRLLADAGERSRMRDALGTPGQASGAAQAAAALCECVFPA